MKKIVIAIAILSVALMSSPTEADEHRGGDAALGALSGAVVFGPIGAIAGAAVGYAAGPSIAHSWGFRRSSPSARARAASGDSRATEARAQASGAAAPATPARASKTPAANAAAYGSGPVPKTASTAPPVQDLE